MRSLENFGIGLIVGALEIVGLVLVHPDDPGHSGVIEPARLGQGRLQQAELSGGDLDTLADVPGEPANLADGVPVLLALAAHPAERRARGPDAGRDLPGPAALLTVTFRSPATSTPTIRPARCPLPVGFLQFNACSSAPSRADSCQIRAGGAAGVKTGRRPPRRGVVLTLAAVDRN